MQRRRADCDFSVNAFPLSLTADKSFNRFPETQHVWNRWLHRKKNADKVLLNGLKRLEYRGYDSAGFATNSGGQTHVRQPAWCTSLNFASKVNRSAALSASQTPAGLASSHLPP